MLQNKEQIRKYNNFEKNIANLGEIKEKEMGVLVFLMWVLLKK